MLSNIPQYLAYARKAIVQIIGLCGSLLALGLLPDKYSAIVAGAIGLLTTVLHFITPNAPAPGSVPAEEVIDEDVEPDAEWLPSNLVTASQVASEHQIAAPPTE